MWKVVDCVDSCHILDNASILNDCPMPDGYPWAAKAAHWTKRVILHVAHDYTTRTLTLAIVPLVLGLFVGWWLGRQHAWMSRVIGSLMMGGKPKELRHEFGILKRAPTSPTSVMTDTPLDEKEENSRQQLRNASSERESTVPLELLPRHIAIIMDGNRRYGKQVYGQAAAGHWDGSRKVLEVCTWALAEQIPMLTVYAFSTENWNRDAREISTLMDLFARYCEELRVEARKRSIQVKILATDPTPIPAHVRAGLDRLEAHTACDQPKLQLNICMSYGSRGEIVEACRNMAQQCKEGTLAVDDISANTFQNHLTTAGLSDPDLLIRTSGEVRLSNFLLWQLAYAELFFLPCNWPEVNKDDLLHIIETYATGRQRRYGK